MPFPPVKTFIVHRSNWYSLAGSVSVSVGSLEDEYPAENSIDGSIGPMTRWTGHSAGLDVSFGAANCNILGILNHNLDPNLLIQPYINGSPLSRTFRVSYPNCWIDLRGFEDLQATGISVSSAGFQVFGNSKPVAISEFVVAGGYVFDGTIEKPYPAEYSFKNTRHRTEHGKVLEAGFGTYSRKLTLNLQVNGDTELTFLNSIWADFAEHGAKVIVVPTTRHNDIWCVEWPLRKAINYPASAQLVRVPLELTESGGGLLI